MDYPTSKTDSAAPLVDDTGFGTPIDRAAAQAYVDNFIRIDAGLKQDVLPTVDKPILVMGLSPVQPSEVHNLFGQNFNGFMFDKEAVDRFFDKGANYLLVLLGAKPDGSATIVLVGCDRKPDEPGGTFVSVFDDLVATEQPPRLIVPKVPLADDKKFSFDLR